ncbi:MAG: YbhB/YbcL family Raf kinase inhibitor-like protein [Rhodospirillales bacterium CG15_BIG_FIL_POST_REV_8_21_14_020_66_15]|nr:MAG: YbhB/YbcL family Raf kinase inhibitor-like protein [Rhodospirillales bacterium CG15_BIG_FIL_POST_REV_8_21_14_020_66_15]
MGFALSDMKVSSTAFGDGGAIPVKYTGEGDDVSPPLAWTDAPAGIRSFAVLCHDPDAPLVSERGTYGFVHWVLYNIPGSARSLPEAVASYTAGLSDFGRTGYGGPMPPPGHGVHRYYFWLLGLTSEPDLEAGLTLWELLKRIAPDLVGMNRLVGTYERT